MSFPPRLTTPPLMSWILLAVCGLLGVLLAPRFLRHPSPPPSAPAAASSLRAAPEVVKNDAAKNDVAKHDDAPPSQPERHINKIWSDGRGVVWVGGGAGRVWRSADHGQTFARVAMPVREALVGVTGRPGGPVVMATEHALYRSHDSGAHWTLSAQLEPDDSETTPVLAGLYSDGRTLWAHAGSDGMRAVYTMALEGRRLSRLPGSYDSILDVLGRRGAVLVLNVVYNCHSGDYTAVDRLNGNRESRRVEKGADDFAESAAGARAAYMTPGGDLYLLAGWSGESSEQMLLRRRAGANEFQRAPLIAEALWASDGGEVLVTTPRDEVRRSTDRGSSFGQAVALP